MPIPDVDTLLWSWGPGESRFALLAGERVVELAIDRPDCLVGARFVGRVVGLQRGLGGAFVALGVGDRPGFLPKAGGLSEGEAVRVVVRADGWGGKGPLLARESGPLPPDLAVPGLIDRPHPLERLAAAHPGLARIIVDEAHAFAEAHALFPALAERDRDAMTALIDEAIDEALAPVVALPSGGRLMIEETAALTAIDVDAGGGGAAEANREAVGLIARHLRLRGIGGQVVVDFVRTGKGTVHRLAQALKQAIAADPVPTHLFGVSGLGLVELVRERRGPSLGERLVQTMRRPHPATQVDSALRRLLVESHVRPGARLALAVGPDLAQALARSGAALAKAEARLGHRLTLRPLPGPDPDEARIEDESR